MSERALLDELRGARWFGGKNRRIRQARVVDRACWTEEAAVCLVEVVYEDGAPETYVLTERFEDPPVARALLRGFSGARVGTERGGALVFSPTRLLADVTRERSEPVVLMRGEQSNTSLRFGDALMLKLFRRFQLGPNPEVEIGRFLTEHTDFRGTPAVAASLEYVAPHGRSGSLALLQVFQPNRGDAWTTTLERLRHVLRGGSLEDSIDSVGRLGATTAALHVALVRPGGGPDFDPRAIDDTDVAAWRQAIAGEVDVAVEALRRRDILLDPGPLLSRIGGIAGLRGSLKTRHHGDYHLGQVLETVDGQFVIIDFEGEPSRPLATRREKRSPLRDVAGMLRSFDYARHAALREADADNPVRRARAEAWYSAVRASFLEAYQTLVQREAPALLPANIAPPLAALALEKAAYEVLYELNNRPDWLPIPLAALAGPPSVTL
ncbi:MAG: hypothetical protein M3336_00785 [Chloroflexota bacterium]|nr:hypothetical protein [Chloroflexota bacterium]